MDVWVQIAKDFGVPVGCLAILIFAVWRTLTWTATNVVLPVVKRHLEFIDQLSKAVTTITEQLGEVRQVIVKTNNVQITAQPPVNQTK